VSYAPPMSGTFKSSAAADAVDLLSPPPSGRTADSDDEYDDEVHFAVNKPLNVQVTTVSSLKRFAFHELHRHNSHGEAPPAHETHHQGRLAPWDVVFWRTLTGDPQAPEGVEL